jgi:hypothetical protein
MRSRQRLLDSVDVAVDISVIMESLLNMDWSRILLKEPLLLPVPVPVPVPLPLLAMLAVLGDGAADVIAEDELEYEETGVGGDGVLVRGEHAHAHAQDGSDVVSATSDISDAREVEASRRIFSGFRSQWTTRASCSATIAVTICFVKFLTISRGRPSYCVQAMASMSDIPRLSSTIQWWLLKQK